MEEDAVVRRTLHVFASVVFVLLLSEAVSVGSDAFTRISLPHGISIEVPAHWTVLSEATRANLSAVGQSVIELSGLETASETRVNLLAVNATPSPCGATIRVAYSSPPTFTEEQIESIDKETLAMLGKMQGEVFRKLEARGGPRLIGEPTAVIAKVGGIRSLGIEYLREDPSGRGPWRVTIFHTPVGKWGTSITVSYREREATMWYPIVFKSIMSVRFTAVK